MHTFRYRWLKHGNTLFTYIKGESGATIKILNLFFDSLNLERKEKGTT